MYEKPKASRYILYARKSTENEDRQVASIESQLQVMRDKAKELGVTVVYELSESGSAFKEGRKEFSNMVKLIKARQADGVICWKLSRLSRNPEDAGVVIGMLQKKELKHIRTIDRDWYPEDNVLMMYLEFGLTNQFSKDLSVDTNRGIERKASRGWFPYASVPLGYLHSPYKQLGDKEIINDPERFETIQYLLQLMSKGGYNVEELYKKATMELNLKTKKGLPIPRTTFYRMFGSRFYCGEFEFPMNSGEYLQGKHNSMITQEQFNINQSIIHGTRICSSNVMHEHKYVGLLKCANCGYSITADPVRKKVQKSGKEHSYAYYHCASKHKVPECSNTYIEVADLESQFTELFKSVNVPKALLLWGISQISNEMFQANSIEIKSKENLQKLISDTEAKQSSLLDLLINKSITQEQYDKKNTEFQKAIDDTNQQIKTFRDPFDELRNRSESFGKDLQDRFFNGDKNKKREILFALGSNHFVKDKKVHLDVNPVIKFLGSAPEDLKEYADRLEPVLGTEYWTQIGDKVHENITWGGLWRDIRTELVNCYLVAIS